MTRLVDIINGPNLNMLGTRRPEVYGSATLADAEAVCAALAGELGLCTRFRQSNAEHEMVDWIQQDRTEAAGIIINPAAYSHTSIALHDALEAFEGPVIEVHISNIHRREAFRRHSYVSLVADAVIAGCGIDGYALAVRRMGQLLA